MVKITIFDNFIQRISILFFLINTCTAQSHINFILPIKINTPIQITSKFGFRIHPITYVRTMHTAIDLSANNFTDVYASATGIVKKIDFDENLGIYVVIRHPDSRESWYGHLFGVCVEAGQNIHLGEQIGWVGNTGRATGPHVHFGIKQNGKWIDPLKLLLR